MGVETLSNYLHADSKFRNSLSYNCGEMVLEVKERLVMTTPLWLLLVFRTHWQVKVEVSDRQLPELMLAQKWLQYFSKFYWAALAAMQIFLEMRYCLRKCF